MIKIEKTDIYGVETAIRGMRNPLNSWDKSDSAWCQLFEKCYDYNTCDECPYSNSMGYCVGDKDMNLMKKLIAAGPDHSKFMRMINVTVDLTAPLYWWKEFDTYKVGTVRNSCSTMHKITEKRFTLDDFSYEHLITRFDGVNEQADVMISKDYNQYNLSATEVLGITVQTLNHYREQFITTKEKKYWWQIIQLLPSSYNQKATVQMNYAVLRNMYHSRKNHKLDEWHTFCEWIEKLPFSELITM